MIGLNSPSSISMNSIYSIHSTVVSYVISSLTSMFMLITLFLLWGSDVYSSMLLSSFTSSAVGYDSFTIIVITLILLLNLNLCFCRSIIDLVLNIMSILVMLVYLLTILGLLESSLLLVFAYIGSILILFVVHSFIDCMLLTLIVFWSFWFRVVFAFISDCVSILAFFTSLSVINFLAYVCGIKSDKVIGVLYALFYYLFTKLYWLLFWFLLLLLLLFIIVYLFFLLSSITLLVFVIIFIIMLPWILVICGIMSFCSMLSCVAIEISAVGYAFLFVIYFLFYLGLLFIIGYLWFVILMWLNDLYVESFLFFTMHEQLLLTYAIKLFIFSEVMLFFCCFWCYFNLLFGCLIALLCSFPIFSFLTFSLPLANLLILIFSSFGIQAASCLFIIGFLHSPTDAMFGTLIPSFGFLSVQLKEFLYSFFSIIDIIIGTIFYFTVGLHGLHVLIGSFFLYFITLILLKLLAPFGRYVRSWHSLPLTSSTSSSSSNFYLVAYYVLLFYGYSLRSSSSSSVFILSLLISCLLFYSYWLVYYFSLLLSLMTMFYWLSFCFGSFLISFYCYYFYLIHSFLTYALLSYLRTLYCVLYLFYSYYVIILLHYCYYAFLFYCLFIPVITLLFDYIFSYYSSSLLSLFSTPMFLLITCFLFSVYYFLTMFWYSNCAAFISYYIMIYYSSLYFLFVTLFLYCHERMCFLHCKKEYIGSYLYWLVIYFYFADDDVRSVRSNDDKIVHIIPFFIESCSLLYFSSIYWHMVDIIWVLVFSFFYY